MVNELYDAFYNIQVDNKNDKFEKIWQKQLRCVLETDIHSPLLGCKISNTHIKIGKIHMDTFYEAQFLFGNAYWCSLFSSWLKNEITMQIEHSKNPYIVVVGSENLLQPLLHALRESYGENLDYCIYEVEKFLYRNKKSLSRFRNIENIKKKLDEMADQKLTDEIYLVFLTSISSTLTTHINLKRSFFKEIETPSTAKISYYSIIQSLPKNALYQGENNIKYFFIEGTNAEPDFSFDDNKKICTRTMSYFEGKKEQSEEIDVHYVVDVFANWYKPDECSLCGLRKEGNKFKYNYLDERPLISTDETSLIPSQMIFLNTMNKTKSPASKDDGIDFFIKKENRYLFLDFLYYNHLTRDEHHYQYYIKTEALLRYIISCSMKNNNKAITEVCNQYFSFFQNAKKTLRTSLKDNNINVLVAPAHYSNEIFCSEINKYVFDNRAHIIQFDAKKEYRSNFETKFSNFSYLVNNLNQGTKFKINFYFVDDQLITGATYYRAKSFVRSSIYAFTKRKELKNLDKYFSLFEGIFVLVNRHSESSKLDFMEINKSGLAKNYFSLFNFYVPSLRNFGDTCPLCKKVDFDRKMWMENSNLSKDAFHWQKKQIFYSEKTIDEVNMVYQEFNINKERYFRRFYCENFLWKHLKGKNNIGTETLIEILSCIIKQQTSTKEQMEHIISFLKVLCRPALIYREQVKKACLKLMLYLANEFFAKLTNKQFKQKLIKIMKLNQESFIFADELSIELIQDFRKIIVSCLSEINSNYLIDINNLNQIYELIYVDYLHQSLEDLYFIRNSVQKLINGIDSLNKKQLFFRQISEYISSTYSIQKDYYKSFDFNYFWFPLYIESYSEKRPNYDFAEYINHKFNVNNKEDDKELDKKMFICIDALEFNEKLKTNPHEKRLLPINNLQQENFIQSILQKNNDMNRIIDHLDKNDFYLEENFNGVWIKITNNFRKIEKEIKENYNSNKREFLNNWLNYLNNQKSYSIFCYMKLEGTFIERLNEIARFAVERRNILEKNKKNLSSEYVKDFISSRMRNRLLMNPKVVAHGLNLDLLYLAQNIDYIYDKQPNFDSLYLNDLKVFADSMISIGYREQTIKNEIIEKYEYTNFDETMKKFYLKNSLKPFKALIFTISVYVNENQNNNQTNTKFVIKDSKLLENCNDYYTYGFFRFGYDYIITSALFVILFENALKYNIGEKIKICFTKDERENVWMSIKNKFNKKEVPYSAGITQNTLKKFFNSNEYEHKVYDEESEFEVKLMIGKKVIDSGN